MSLHVFLDQTKPLAAFLRAMRPCSSRNSEAPTGACYVAILSVESFMSQNGKATTVQPNNIYTMLFFSFDLMCGVCLTWCYSHLLDVAALMCIPTWWAMSSAVTRGVSFWVAHFGSQGSPSCCTNVKKDGQRWSKIVRYKQVWLSISFL